MATRIAIINCGSEDQEALTEDGRDYNASELLSRKAVRLMESFGASATARIYRPPEDRRDFPDPGGFDAAIIPGSKHDLDDKEMRSNPWMVDLLAFIREAHSASKPLLGICFGHQAIGVAFGCRLHRMGPGPELGLKPAALTPDGVSDPLFYGVPPRFDAMQFHHCCLLRPPDGGTALAWGESPRIVQALRVGSSSWGVQFHPDYSSANMAQIIGRHRESLSAKTDLSGIRLEGERHDSRVLGNFLRVVRSSLSG
jgi:GMP synthase-like glutamine amidotransferase